MVGVGFVLVSPQYYVLPRVFLLIESCSNNVVECNALLIGMRIARKLGERNLEVYGDFFLIVN